MAAGDEDDSPCSQNYSRTHAIVTAASNRRSQALTWFLVNAVRHSRCETIIVYDLGLSHRQITWITGIARYEAPLILRTFDFSKYPGFFDLEENNNGEYAWKPAIIEEVLREYEFTLWMDSGSFLRQNPEWIFQVLAVEGFYATTSSGTIRQWTHPGMLRYYEISEDMPFLDTRPCHAGFQGYYAPLSLSQLVTPLLQCAMVLKCIGPSGSNHSNHRYDQAALSILVALSNNTFTCRKPSTLLGLCQPQADHAFSADPPVSLEKIFSLSVPATLSTVRLYTCPGCLNKDGFALVDILGLLLTQVCNHAVSPRFGYVGSGHVGYMVDLGRMILPQALHMVKPLEISTFTQLLTVIHIDLDTTPVAEQVENLGEICRKALRMCGAVALGQTSSNEKVDLHQGVAHRNQLHLIEILLPGVTFKSTTMVIPADREHPDRTMLVTVASQVNLARVFKLEGLHTLL